MSAERLRHGQLAPDRLNPEDPYLSGLTDDMGLYLAYETLVCHECPKCAGCKTLDDDFCSHAPCSCGTEIEVPWGAYGLALQSAYYFPEDSA